MEKDVDAMAMGSGHAARGRKQAALPGRAHLSALFPKGRTDPVMTLRLFRSKPPRLSPDLDRQERQGLGLRQPLAQSQVRPPGETLPLCGPRELALGCGGTWRERGLWINRPQGPQAESFPSAQATGTVGAERPGEGPRAQGHRGLSVPSDRPGRRETRPHGPSPLVLAPDEGLGFFRPLVPRAGLHDAPGKDA